MDKNILTVVQSLFDSQNYGEVEKLVSELPDDKLALKYYILGMMKYAVKNLSESLSFMILASKEEPSNLEYKGKVIEISFNLEKYDTSILYCLDYLKIQENNTVRLALAKTFVKLQRAHNAFEHFEKCFNDGMQTEEVVENLIMGAFNSSNYNNLQKYCDIFNKISTNEDRKNAILIIQHLFIEGNLGSHEEIEKDRLRFKTNIQKLRDMKLNVKNMNAFLTPWCAKVGFPLSYHHMNNSELLKDFSLLHREMCPDLQYIAKHCVNPTKRQNSRIRIGFISAFFRDHSVSKDRRGIIKNLDRDRFSVFSLFMNDPKDEMGLEIVDSTVFIKLDSDIYKARQKIEQLELDILVYCEIGMHMPTFLMAHFRLAPIQIVSWGHSDTSGISTIDYFTSSVLYEIEKYDAQTHYSENLILNDSLCTYYYNPIKRFDKLKPNEMVMKVFNDKNIYVCPGSLIKMHPQMDIIFDKLLKKDPNGVIVMIGDDVHKFRFEKRLKGVVGNNISRIAFVETKFDPNYFASILACGIVILDTYPFGGCNTVLETFSIGKPIVTLPGEFINGRFAYGFCKKMNIMEMVAKDFDDYVDIAVKFAYDKDFNNTVINKIKQRSSMLYENNECVQEWNEMLDSLYKLQFREVLTQPIKQKIINNINGVLNLAKLPHPVDILIFGCEFPNDYQALLTAFPSSNIYVSDPDENILNLFKTKYTYLSDRLKFINVGQLITSLSFDLIYCNSSLENILDSKVFGPDTDYTFDEFKKTINFMTNLLRSNGIFVVVNSKYRVIDSPAFRKYKLLDDKIHFSVNVYDKFGVKTSSLCNYLFLKSSF